jgi:hypothetical protein
VRITPLRGTGIVWFTCPACRLKCRPTAVGPDGGCPRCGHARMLRLFLGGRPAQPDTSIDRASGTHRN